RRMRHRKKPRVKHATDRRAYFLFRQLLRKETVSSLGTRFLEYDLTKPQKAPQQLVLSPRVSGQSNCSSPGGAGGDVVLDASERAARIVGDARRMTYFVCFIPSPSTLHGYQSPLPESK